MLTDVSCQHTSLASVYQRDSTVALQQIVACRVSIQIANESGGPGKKCFDGCSFWYSTCRNRYRQPVQSLLHSVPAMCRPGPPSRSCACCGVRSGSNHNQHPNDPQHQKDYLPTFVSSSYPFTQSFSLLIRSLGLEMYEQRAFRQAKTTERFAPWQQQQQYVIT